MGYMQERQILFYYTPEEKHPDVVLRLTRFEGPVRDRESQAIIDFAGHVGVSAYVSEEISLSDPWRVELWAFFEIETCAAAPSAIPEGLNDYDAVRGIQHIIEF